MMADAQFKVKSTYKTEHILSIRLGFIDLNYDGSYYLAMETTNQFDDPLILPLGKSKQKAMETIESLINITTTIKKEDTITIMTLYGEEFRIYKHGKNIISIDADYRAGYSNITKAELKRILDTIAYDIR